MTSQYAISKVRKDLKRLQAELEAAKAKHADYAARGCFGADEAAWRVEHLQESIDQLQQWLAAAKPEKFVDWSPARLKRHQQRHDQL